MRKALFCGIFLLLAFGLCAPPTRAQELPGNESTRGALPASVYVKTIRFSGNTVVETPILEKIVAPYTDSELTLDDMSALTDLVTMAYQDRGYILARAYLPEQEIVDGVLTIAVAEGRLGKITVTGGRHYDERVVTRFFKPQETEGVIKEELLEKGLLLANETPDLKTDLLLKEGANPGEVDVILKTEDRSTLTFGAEISLDYNNFGTDLVSENRYGATLKITDHQFGTTTTVRGITGDEGEESSLGLFDFSMPLNRYGTRLALGYLESNYVIGQELADLGMGGWSKTYSAALDHPLLKRKNLALAVGLGYDHKYSKNTVLDEDYSADEIDLYHLTVSFDNVDRFIGKNILSLSGYSGQVYFDDTLPTSRGYGEANTDATFAKVLLRAARIQKIHENTNLMLRGSAQWSGQRLVAMEQFGIGGFGTVRGYPTSLYLGDSGYNLSAELLFAPPWIAAETLFAQRLSQLVKFALFFDHGGVYNTDAEAGEYDSQALSGYGGGIRLYYKDRFSFKYDLGLAIDEVNGQPDHFNYFQVAFNFF